MTRKGNIGRVILRASRTRRPPQLRLPLSQRHPLHRFPVRKLLKNVRLTNHQLTNTHLTNHQPTNMFFMNQHLTSRLLGNMCLTDQPPFSQSLENLNIVNLPHHPPLNHRHLIPCLNRPPLTMRETIRVQQPLLRRLRPSHQSHHPLPQDPYPLPSFVPNIPTS